MANTIKIGGRTLDVAECTIGFWKRLSAFDNKGTAEAVDAGVGLFLEVLQHNDGVTREWLEDNLPMRRASLDAKLRELLVAGGLLTEEKPAEGEPQAR